MKWTEWGAQAAERGWLPDWLIRLGIRRLCGRRLQQPDRHNCEANQESMERFLEFLRSSPVALVPEKANEQHYEVPAAFFEQVLGPHRKYSCCYWEGAGGGLEQAEQRALELTCNHADLVDGVDILELGCGWGSLTLFMAEKFPNARITAVSNSASQREEIERRAALRGFRNVAVVTADMNDFEPRVSFDRVVSVEMFEHMRNYEVLLRRIASWLRPDGTLFVHIFSHDRLAYPFETEGPDDWMGKYFFSGGVMPSDGLLHRFAQDLQVTRRWRWNGRHYARTCNAWLARQDERRAAILPILAQAYGVDLAELWFQRWRMFFMACAELFGLRGGEEWGVSHYLLSKRK